MIYVMLAIATLCGFSAGMIVAAYGAHRRANTIINSITKMSDAYAFVIHGITSGQIRVAEVPMMLNRKANSVGIVADDIEFYLEEGFNESQILEALYESLQTALEDERLDVIDPLKKFDFFEGLEETN